MTKVRWSEIFTQNLSYKAVSLFIALILWVTILGRRDFVLTKTIEVEFILPAHFQVISQNTDHVKVKIAGPRTALKRFVDSGSSQLLPIQFATQTEGSFEVEVPVQKIDLPFGVKVMSVKPAKIHVQVGRKPN